MTQKEMTLTKIFMYIWKVLRVCFCLCCDKGTLSWLSFATEDFSYMLYQNPLQFTTRVLTEDIFWVCNLNSKAKVWGINDYYSSVLQTKSHKISGRVLPNVSNSAGRPGNRKSFMLQLYTASSVWITVTGEQ